MFVIMTKVSFFVILLLIIQCRTQETTLKTLFIETTTEYISVITDIPEEDVEQALNHDYGRYTTQAFRYHNNQDYRFFDQRFERCFDDMIRCNINVVVPVPVCVYNDPGDRGEGYRTFLTYCDAYFDNCLREMRFWRILDFGKCVLTGEKEDENIIQKTRRKYGTNFRELYDTLTSKKK